ncbi:MAG: UDP-N-acetyl glucosamine 2-epimerase [Desulfarculus sp.]|nr:UDP-N-acetyl glucosamine 2-epimerase [Desulfarculus sp.]
MPSEPAPAWLLATSQPLLRELVPVAEAMLAQNAFRPVFIPATPQMRAVCQETAPAGAQVLDPPWPSEPQPGRLAAGLDRRLPLPLLAWRWSRRRLGASLAWARERVRLDPPAAVLAGCDRILAGLPFLGAAKAAGRPILLAPYALSGDDWQRRRQSPFHRLDQGPHRSLKTRLAQQHPDQVCQTPAGPLFFYPPATLLALRSLGLLPARPWLLGGSLADRVAVAGEEDRERLLALGLAEDRVVVTGQPSLDLLLAAGRDRHRLRDLLVTRHGLDSRRPLAIWAVPPMDWMEFDDEASYWRALRSWAQALGGLELNLLWSLHPKSESPLYRELAEQTGGRLLTEPMAEALPAADLLVAAGSSTLRWAAMLGIPALDTLFYRQRGEGFADYPGVEFVAEPAQAARAALSLLTDPGLHRSRAQAQRQRGARLCALDGQACPRIVDLARQLAG